MATKRRAPSRASPGPASRRRGAGSRDVAVGRGRTGRAGTGLRVSSQAARALVGLLLLVAGAVTLIALMLPGEGILNQYVSDLLRPAFGQGAWLLPFLLLTAGFFVERAPNAGNGWGITAIGGLIIFTGALGLIHVVWGEGTSDASVRQAGGFLGARLAEALADLVSRPGAFVVLLGIVLAGVVLLFNLTVRGMLRPVTAGGRVVAEAVSGSFRPRTDDAGRASGPAAQRRERSRGGRAASASAEGNGSDEAAAGRTRKQHADPELPAPDPSPAPMSQTVWSALGETGPSQVSQNEQGNGAATPMGRSVGPGIGPGRSSSPEGQEPQTELLQADDGRPAHEGRPWMLPELEKLGELDRRAVGRQLDHERNVRIIEEKLRSFQIPATVTGTNTGPVVTQYEVRPDARVKLSRIEGLADDLAMALAARSIRIEAPIPGRDVVGIEIPNHSSEVVGFRSLLEDARMSEAASRLNFALGRDVSGKAYAVDLAKMPHLLIAGATGSGKSVCVNALITSILVRARPDAVRFILVDLKRVELASYDGLPHLLTNVIVEANDAKSALHWAVAQMEERYKALASRAERNISAYNASPRVEPGEQLPYIVVVIDELADLMMREGRKVEDPIVKLAQKARAVGIHLVLATQRPSVNVVTGLIKANVPSRIAFAMSSNVDSRTVLDQPGAEDLIGRGDMLYQPADLPRPVRLQGVFVSDAEVRAVGDHWRAQAPDPDYDPDVTAFADADGGGGGQFAWLSQSAGDDMAARAAELVVSTGRASTSMLQTKLKVGFNRASRMMDELERVGVVGPQDPRNPAVPRQVYGPDNWLRGPADVDDGD